MKFVDGLPKVVMSADLALESVWIGQGCRAHTVMSSFCHVYSNSRMLGKKGITKVYTQVRMFAQCEQRKSISFYSLGSSRISFFS